LIEHLARTQDLTVENPNRKAVSSFCFEEIYWVTLLAMRWTAFAAWVFSCAAFFTSLVILITQVPVPGNKNNPTTIGTARHLYSHSLYS
jgi:hypothetical protein